MNFTVVFVVLVCLLLPGCDETRTITCGPLTTKDPKVVCVSNEYLVCMDYIHGKVTAFTIRKINESEIIGSDIEKSDGVRIEFGNDIILIEDAVYWNDSKIDFINSLKVNRADKRLIDNKISTKLIRLFENGIDSGVVVIDNAEVHVEAAKKVFIDTMEQYDYVVVEYSSGDKRYGGMNEWLCGLSGERLVIKYEGLPRSSR